MHNNRLTCLMIWFILVAGAWAKTDSVINNFNNTNGAIPASGVTVDKSGNVYGTTFEGGSHGMGTVYQLVDTNGTWNETVLYSFTGGTDGGSPLGSVVVDRSGSVYGTTLYGGDTSCDCGVVFQLTNSGGSWSETVLHAFTGGADGGQPFAGLTTDSAGRIFGTTSSGGNKGCSSGCGTVFRLQLVDGTWRETVLHSFKNNGKDGIAPAAPVVLDKQGNLYGSTQNGGDFQACQGGCGAVFVLTRPTKKGGVWKETILHAFLGGDDGAYPTEPIRDRSGNLFGTTYTGGTSGNAGTVFELKRSGKKYANHVILNLNNSIGASPNGLAMDSAGNLYGTTNGQGLNGCGMVFKLRASSWKYVDIHDFQNNSSDGCDPQSGPTLDSSGNLFGSAGSGGTDGYGVVYQIAP